MSDSSVPNPLSPEINSIIASFITNLNVTNEQESENEIMAPPVFDIKNLSIVPVFDGNPNELKEFLTVSTMLLNNYFDATPSNIGCIQNCLLLHGLMSRLSGRAKEVISIYGCETWDSVKNTLIQHFGDQRDENALTRDLVNLRQQQYETPLQFYEKCMGLLSAICNYIDLHNDDGAIKTSKKIFFRQQALTTFLAGLKEPLGSTIRAMRPDSLAKAIQYIREENNIRYLQRSAPQNPISLVTTRKPVQQTPQCNPTTRFSQPPNWNHRYTTSSFPQGPIKLPSKTNAPPQRFPSNQQVFGKPTNAWAPRNTPGPSNQPPATPMSISTANTNKQLTRRFHTNVQPYVPNQKFVTEELFNVEHQDQYYADDDQENCEYYVEDSSEVPEQQNFHEAGEPPEEP